MDLPPGLMHTLAQTHLFTDAQRYVILRISHDQYHEAHALLAQHTAPFAALVVDKDEVTLVVAAALWETARPTLSVVDETPLYRLITFDLPLDLGLVGYLATLCGVIAEAGISIISLSAFSRDHIFVQEDDFDRAWATLRDFIRLCQAQEIDDRV